MEISTPGRVCLFGEHQDYLGLPVIAMAISLRSVISGISRNDTSIIIRKPDINETEKFDLVKLNYHSKRDYFKSGIKVCKDVGLFDKLADQFNIPADISKLMNKIFQEGLNKYGKRSLSTSIVRRLEEKCNEKLRAPNFPSQLNDNKIKKKGMEIKF